MQKLHTFSPLAVLLLLFVAACNTSSDAARVLESDNISLRATISYYQNLDPTMTAEYAGMTEQVATLQTDLERARQEVKNLTVRLNNASSSPSPLEPTIVTSNPGDFGSLRTSPVPPTPLAPPPDATPGRVQLGGMVMEQIQTARGLDSFGCAVEPATSFSTSDSQIYVVATVLNYTRGITFSARWVGNAFEHSNDWTVQANGRQMCVHFYVEPRTLQMLPGSYTVIFSATNGSERAESAPLSFVVQ